MDFINSWSWIDLETTPSTNDEAKKYDKKIIISAREQTAGRGRRGRSWIGLEGNLFVSINIDFEPRVLGQMMIRTALAMFLTIKQIRPDADVKLKWPNDVLVNGKKVSGILAEKSMGDFFVIGIGVNIKTAPLIEGLIYPAICLKDAGIEIDRLEFLQKLIKTFDEVLAQDFDKVKKTWLLNVKDLGCNIKVKDENFEYHGVFEGIDDNGMLLVKTDNGVTRVLAGNVL